MLELNDVTEGTNQSDSSVQKKISPNVENVNSEPLESSREGSKPSEGVDFNEEHNNTIESECENEGKDELSATKFDQSENPDKDDAAQISVQDKSNLRDEPLEPEKLSTPDIEKAKMEEDAKVGKDSHGNSMHDNLHDPSLFEKNAPGEYTYESGNSGKKAYGTLEVSDKGVRDLQAQRSVGGEDRKADDDGGHLIGTRFNGAPDSRNLDAQNSNLNRGSYNHHEKSWQDAINNGDKVYVNIETPRSNGSERPDAYMGYSITEHPDGRREWDAFSYQNASQAEQESWNRDLDAFDSENPEQYDNPMQEVYEQQGYHPNEEY